MTTIAEVPPPVYYYEEIFMSIEYMIGVVIIAITIGSAAQMVENANRLPSIAGEPILYTNFRVS